MTPQEFTDRWALYPLAESLHNYMSEEVPSVMSEDGPLLELAPSVRRLHRWTEKELATCRDELKDEGGKLLVATADILWVSVQYLQHVSDAMKKLDL